MGPWKSSREFTACYFSLQPNFFVRLESPFLRPDPQHPNAVARRGCQGWPSLKYLLMIRRCQATPCMGPWKSSREFTACYFFLQPNFFVRLESPFLRPDPQHPNAVARRGCQGWPSLKYLLMIRRCQATPCMGPWKSSREFTACYFFLQPNFFVRLESPFLRPDPQHPNAVARRGCQGWPSLKYLLMIRRCQATPCMGPWKSSREFTACYFFLQPNFFVRLESPFLRPDPQHPNAVARRGCQGWPSLKYLLMIRRCQATPCMGPWKSSREFTACYFFLQPNFFVRLESPFLRPDPQHPNAVARRGCQGWPSLKYLLMIRRCQATPCMGPWKSSREFTACYFFLQPNFFVRLESPFLRPDPQHPN